MLVSIAWHAAPALLIFCHILVFSIIQVDSLLPRPEANDAFSRWHLVLDVVAADVVLLEVEATGVLMK
jgi:hypothetical protein